MLCHSELNRCQCELTCCPQQHLVSVMSDSLTDATHSALSMMMVTLSSVQVVLVPWRTVSVRYCSLQFWIRPCPTCAAGGLRQRRGTGDSNHRYAGSWRPLQASASLLTPFILKLPRRLWRQARTSSTMSWPAGGTPTCCPRCGLPLQPLHTDALPANLLSHSWSFCIEQL